MGRKHICKGNSNKVIFCVIKGESIWDCIDLIEEQCASEATSSIATDGHLLHQNDKCNKVTFQNQKQKGVNMELTQENFDKIQADLTAANGEAASRRTALNAANETLKQFEGVDLDKYKAAMTAQEKLDEELQRKNGEFDTLLETKTSELKTSNEQLTGNIKTLEDQLNTLLIDGGLESAFTAAGAVNPKDMTKLNRDVVGRDEKGVFVKNEDGSPMQKDGKRVTLAEYTAEWIAKNPAYAKAGDGGSGANGGKDNPAGNKMKKSEFDKLDPAAKSEFARNRENTIIDGQLANRKHLKATLLCRVAFFIDIDNCQVQDMPINLNVITSVTCSHWLQLEPVQCEKDNKHFLALA